MDGVVLRPALLLVAEVVAIYSGLFLLGFWLSRLLGRRASTFESPVTAMLGLIVLQLVAWYTSSILDVGLDRVWPWMLGASVALGAGTVAIERDMFRPSSLLARMHAGRCRSTLASFIAGAGCLLIVIWQRHSLLQRGVLSIAAENNDVASYVLISDDIRKGGFSSHGSWVGFHMGRFARNDVDGAVSFIALARWLTGRLGFQIVLAVIAVAAMLLTQAIARLLARITTLPTLPVALLALAPCSAFIFAYVSMQYFLSQVMAMGFAVVLFDVAMRGEGTRRENFATLASLSFLSIGMLMTYPHMTFLFPVLLVPCLLVKYLHDWRQGVRWLLFLAVGLSLGAILVLPRTVIAIRRLKELRNATNGFPLPGVLPWGLIGEQTQLSHTVTVISVVGSLLVLVMFAVSSRANLRSQSRSSLPLLVMVGVGLGTYAAFYFLRGGPNYSQWKWVSFLQPLIAVGLITPVVEWVNRRSGKRSLLVLPLLLVTFIIINQLNSDRYIGRADKSHTWVSLGLGTLGRDPGLSDVSEVNIDLPPFWLSMWAAAAVAPRTSYVVNQTYFAQSTSKADWTIVRGLPDWVSSDQQPVRSLRDGEFLLVHRPIGQTSMATDGLKGSVSVGFAPGSIGSGTHLQVVVTNVGSSAWLASASGVGGVNLGVQLLDKDQVVTSPNYLRVPVTTAPLVLARGQTRTLEVNLPALPPGTSFVRLDLVAEGVSWFGDIGASEPVTVGLPASGE